ncbi:MAG: DUF6261 family protein [Mediterranea sp.]|jgi:hypothetical protein|nr:DUF6261 family protein [Mediterranea sp.]
MMKKENKIFRFYKLRLSDSIEMAHLIFNNALPPAKAQALGIGKPYNDAKASFNKLEGIFRRNPALLETEELVEIIAKSRRKMSLLKSMFKEALANAKKEDLKAARVLENVANPYLKTIYDDTQFALAANAIKMTNALREPENLPYLRQLEMESIVDEIAGLVNEANDKIYARGEEKAHRKQIGNATNMRRKLEKQLHFLIYYFIPVHYAEADGAQAAMFERTIMDINGVLNSFRHLISGNNRSGSEPDDNNDASENSGTPPAEDPSEGITGPDA